MLTAPANKTTTKINNVYLRPIFAETGALPNAPKNAPACKTETTLDDTAFDFATSVLPFASMRPNSERKNGLETTPPAIPVSYPKRKIPRYVMNASPIREGKDWTMRWRRQTIDTNVLEKVVSRQDQ